MKKMYLLFALGLGSSAAFSQTLFTYGTNPVSKDEFLRAYNKNKTPVDDKEKSFREYLDLYSKFKLKVKVASEQKLDTLQQLQYDLQSFRSQVEDGYMNDEKGLQSLVDEAIIRSQKDIHLLHFSIPVDVAAGADTAKAYKALTDALSALQKNPAEVVNAEQVAKNFAGVTGKDLGYTTVFSLPYEMENLVYGLKPGEVSKIYRTKKALHLFKNAGERQSPGKWKVAQILFAIPPDASQETLKSIEVKADYVYKLLSGGADFTTLAKQYSEDKLTYLNGGEMPEFGTGKFDPVFETAVFNLKKDGDISKPVYTGYGYHIVKRLQQRPMSADKTDESFVYDLKQQITGDSRINAAKAKFAKDILVKSGYKKSALVKQQDLFRYADSVVATGEVGNYPINNKVIFTFTKGTVKGSDWLHFVKDFKLNTDLYKGESNAALLEKYVATAGNEYYRKHLEEFNSEFKYQMQEFKEGNMLFEIMERNIWNKAANDSAGLKKYYDTHKTKYQWGASAAILLFNCSDTKSAQNAIDALKAGKDWKKIAEESDGTVQSDSGRYEIAQLQLPEGTVVKEGLITTPLVNSGDNTTSFMKVLTIFPANQQRTFEEARGLVINEYQNYLEEQWIEQLKKKYPIKVNEVVFRSLLQ